jgi:glycine cleavage system aminomethyltransferase T
MVTLEWDVEDVLDVVRSQFQTEQEPYADISNPDDFSYGFPTYHADMVVNENGDEIGMSTGRMLSYVYRSMISIASVEQEYAELGKDVYVVWGEPGTRQKKIHAKIARWPYFDTDRNQKVDLSKIPQGTMD